MKQMLIVFVGMVLAGAVGARAEEVKATVLSVVGSATATGPSGATSPVKKGDLLSKNSTVETSASGRVAVSLSPGANLIILPNTKIVLSKLEASTSGGRVTSRSSEHSLTRGSVVVDMPGNDAKSELIINNEDGIYKTEGGLAKVTIGSVTVKQVKGKGRLITPDGEEHELNEGDSFTTNTEGGNTTNNRGKNTEDEEEDIENEAGGGGGTGGGGGGGGGGGRLPKNGLGGSGGGSPNNVTNTNRPASPSNPNPFVN